MNADPLDDADQGAPSLALVPTPDVAVLTSPDLLDRVDQVLAEARTLPGQNAMEPTVPIGSMKPRRRRHRHRSTRGFAGGARRFIRALARRAADEGPEELKLLLDLGPELETLAQQVVDRLREQGTTDAQIAQALGCSRRNVSKRWPSAGRYVGGAGRYRRPQQARSDGSSPAAVVEVTTPLTVPHSAGE